jgi:signal transduction histidine kinase
MGEDATTPRAGAIGEASRASVAGRLRTLTPLKPFFDRRVVRAVPAAPRRPGLLSGMRVRKKLIFLHTCFSILLAATLLLTLSPALRAFVREAELDKSLTLMAVAAQSPAFLATQELPESARGEGSPRVRVMAGNASELGIPNALAVRAIGALGTPVASRESVLGPCAVLFVAGPVGPARGDAGRFVILAAELPQARAQVTRTYMVVTGALLMLYLLVVIALETLVLPQAVYGPIRRVLAADQAVQAGRKDAELIAAAEIPADELGEIMRSRNESVIKLRRQEAALGDALAQLEAVATDLRRKNHLLEAAKRNLADADRLAVLGVMSAGIAHELNTPLAVLKGLTERLHEDPSRGVLPEQAALMLRVVRRLERLSEGLLDYARVRPAQSSAADLRTIVEEALTLVRLDREASRVEVRNDVPEGAIIACDADRMTQVFVNLIRNAVDALHGRASGEVVVRSERFTREGRAWVSVTVADDGPGIAPEVIERLFEPFVSTRLDSKGTGLGLAVAEGIVREHAGLLQARNRTDQHGAVFEVLLPCEGVGAGAGVGSVGGASAPSPTRGPSPVQ